MVAATPHPIDISVNDIDNSTKKSGATIEIINTTKKSKLTGTSKTDSNGSALVDLASLPLIDGQSIEYDQGDKILIIAHHPDNGGLHDASLYTVIGDDHTLTLNLNPVPYTGNRNVLDNSRVGLLAIAAANTSGTVYEVKVFAVADGELLIQLECAGNETTSHIFGGERGKGASGGFVIERENSAVVVTVTHR